MLYSVIIRETYSVNREKQKQRPTGKHYENLNGCLYQMSPLRTQGNPAEEEAERPLNFVSIH